MYLLMTFLFSLLFQLTSPTQISLFTIFLVVILQLNYFFFHFWKISWTFITACNEHLPADELERKNNKTLSSPNLGLKFHDFLSACHIIHSKSGIPPVVKKVFTECLLYAKHSSLHLENSEWILQIIHVCEMRVTIKSTHCNKMHKYELLGEHRRRAFLSICKEASQAEHISTTPLFKVFSASVDIQVKGTTVHPADQGRKLYIQPQTVFY